MLDIQLLDDEPRRCPVCRQAGRSPCLLYHHLNRAQDFAPYVTRQMQIDAVERADHSRLVRAQRARRPC